MSETIFIPAKIKVGFQNRKDTYSGKLAYVIYYDARNQLRKKNSWEGWRDEKIEPEEYQNEATEGFVLNKKVGDYKSDWNMRHAYSRIYDPRGFEFEITIENLLWILENTSCIKGKGLEGGFVYGWDNGALLLIPTSSPDYKRISAYSEMITKPEGLIGKDLVLGGTYLTNKNEQWIYLGRFDAYDDTNWKKDKFGNNKGKHYFFYDGSSFQTIKSLSGRIVKTVSVDSVENYAELMDKLMHLPIYSPVDETKNKYVVYSLEELQKIVDNGGYYGSLVYFFCDGRMACSHVEKNWQKDRYYLDNIFWENGGKVSDQYANEYVYTSYYNRYNHFSGAPTLEELHNKHKFMKRLQFLANGNEYKNS